MERSSLAQVNTYARQVIGFGSVKSVNLLLIVNAAGMPTRPLLGFLADRYVGPMNMLLLSSGLLGIVFFVWMGIDNKPSMYGFTVLYGAATGGTQGIFVGALASLTKDLSKAGTRFGMIFSLMSVATLTGAPIAGALIQSSQGSYIPAQVWAGTVTLVGCATVGLARVCETGWRIRVKR